MQILVSLAINLDTEAYDKEYGTGHDDAVDYTADMIADRARETLSNVGGWATVLVVTSKVTAP